MSKICYIHKTFAASSYLVITQAETIIDEYQDQGYTLTLRQLYYQFVSRDLLPNTVQSYKRLGSIINDAKNAGLLPWEAMEDRTRNLETRGSWSSPADIVGACATQFHMSRWETQGWAPEVWIEKEALVGVIERACHELDVPYFACRGYVSGSESWAAGQRFSKALEEGRTPIVFHLGDHDPSGIDMTRDNEERLELYTDYPVEVRRLALNMDQVEEHRPPPNPAKESDARFENYERLYGNKSWELDALEPRLISGMVRGAIQGLIDYDAWGKVERAEKEAKKHIADAAASLRAMEQ